MDKIKAIEFEEFFVDVPDEYKEFMSAKHGILKENGYKLKVERKATGLFASYSHPKTKRSVLNFFFRKNGFYARIYADNHGKYKDFLDNLPERMEKEIAKSTDCKRLIDPADCNQKCIMGYDFYIRSTHYKKCRYNCFQFAVNKESAEILSAFADNEINGRLTDDKE